MAQECQGQLSVVENRLEQARARRTKTRGINDGKTIAMLEDMRLELQSKIRLYQERAQAEKT